MNDHSENRPESMFRDAFRRCITGADGIRPRAGVGAGTSTRAMLRVDEAMQCDGTESAGASVRASAPACLHGLFERQADTRGNAVALVCGEATLSYSALELPPNHLANHLRHLPLRPPPFLRIAFDPSYLP